MIEPTVRVVPAVCEQTADILRRIAIPPAQEDAPLSNTDLRRLPNLYLALVAICHQTSPLGRPRLEGATASGQHLVGWDYLRVRWAERVAEDDSLNQPSRWSSMTGGDVVSILADSQGRSTIGDPEGRALLLRDLGKRMVQSSWDTATDIFDAARSRLATDDPQGLYSRLAQFRAYADPVRKKSSFYLELMRNQCGWRYADPENLDAPVDYHEVRGHLRLGTVEILDPTLAHRIRSSLPVGVAEDEAIRGAVQRAIRLVSDFHGGTDPATLHYCFWNVFRQCCGRVNTHCTACGPTCMLPQRYRTAIEPIAPRRCLLSSICGSAQSANKLIEHVHHTEYY